MKEAGVAGEIIAVSIGPKQVTHSHTTLLSPASLSATLPSCCIVPLLIWVRCVCARVCVVHVRVVGC